MVFHLSSTPRDLVQIRYLHYSSICPGARPSRLLRVDGSPDDGPPEDGPPDDDSLVDGFPDDGFPYTARLAVRSQYFLPQGKVAELRQELNSGGKKDKNHSAKKITLKKIVANMTMSNNDMVALFPDIINCMQIPSLEIKKMYVRHGFVQPRDRTLIWRPGVSCTLSTTQK